jgi:hypothetical protein
VRKDCADVERRGRRRRCIESSVYFKALAKFDVPEIPMPNVGPRFAASQVRRAKLRRCVTEHGARFPHHSRHGRCASMAPMVAYIQATTDT